MPTSISSFRYYDLPLCYFSADLKPQLSIVFKGDLYNLRGVKIDFAPTYKGSALKGKNLLPMGANSFFLEQTPFQ